MGGGGHTNLCLHVQNCTEVSFYLLIWMYLYCIIPLNLAEQALNITASFYIYPFQCFPLNEKVESKKDFLNSCLDEVVKLKFC